MTLAELEGFADRVGIGYRNLTEAELRAKLKFEAN